MRKEVISLKEKRLNPAINRAWLLMNIRKYFDAMRPAYELLYQELDGESCPIAWNG